jgi:hypothetical protein
VFQTLLLAWHTAREKYTEVPRAVQYAILLVLGGKLRGLPAFRGAANAGARMAGRAFWTTTVKRCTGPAYRRLDDSTATFPEDRKEFGYEEHAIASLQAEVAIPRARTADNTSNERKGVLLDANERVACIEDVM